MAVDPGFGPLVYDIARLLSARFNARAIAFFGLTRSQCRIIGCLAGNEGINQAGLAELLEIKPMTLVRQIDRMEQEGWIERRPDPDDRRARRLQLTEKTRPVIADIRQLLGEVRGEAFAGLSDVEERTLLSLLLRVQSNLAEPTVSPPATAPPSAGRPASRHGKRVPPAAGWLAARDCRTGDCRTGDWR